MMLFLRLAKLLMFVGAQLMPKKLKQRKSMSNIVQFLDKLERNVLDNQNALIALAKKNQPFGSIDWIQPKWNVTHAVANKIRGHETRKNKYLNFFCNVPNNKKPMKDHFADLVKALTALRYETGGQGAANQQRFIDAFRYIYDVLEHKKYLIELITPEDLYNACRVASNRLGDGSAYNVHKSVHEVADLLDKNKLVKVHLGFRYDAMSRPENTSGVGFVRLDSEEAKAPTTSEKMLSEEVMQALGILHQRIPSDVYADRMRILLITLATFIGRRIGEILTLPALPVQYTDSGKAYLIYHPQKKAQGDLIVEKSQIYLPTEFIPIIEDAVNEILELTASTREIAEYIHAHQHADYRILEPYEEKGWLDNKELTALLGVTDGNTWAKSRGLTSQPHPSHSNPRVICWPIVQVKMGMDKDIDLRPMLVSGGGNLYHKDCLAIQCLNECQSKKATFYYAVRLFDWQQITDFLGSNSTRRKNTDAVFERYLIGDEVTLLQTNSHAFRHTLNTWLDEGGMPDSAQTKWFGRSNPRDTKAYQNTSPAKAALQVHKDLVDGKISGPVADQLKVLPINIRETYVKARVRAVHDVGPGVCFHDFSQNPCERHLECSAECDDYHWKTGDDGRKDDLKRQYAITKIAHETAQNRAEKGRGGAMDWVNHNDKKISVLLKQMEEQDIEEFDPKDYLEALENE